MTLRERSSAGREPMPHPGFFPFLLLDYAAARAFTKVAVLMRLSAMTPSPTHRAMPSGPW